MNDQTADREGLAEVLHGEHRVWLGDAYGMHPIDVSPELADHLTDAILASPQFARIIAEAEARALREAADAWTQGVWATTIPTLRVTDWLASGQAVGDWLRDRAALVAPDAGGEG